MLELGDELVDALRHVLAFLVGVEELAFQRADASVLLFEPTPQRSRLFLLSPMGADQIVDGTLQPLEVVRVSLDSGNRRTPLSLNRTRRAGSPSTREAEDLQRLPRGIYT